MEELRFAKRIYREQKFNLFVPYNELTTRKDLPLEVGSRTLFVQGSIDLLIETKDGELLLYDYKTDRIPNEEQLDEALLCQHMKDAHGNQLVYYQRAVRELFGKAPDKTYIYSLPLGRSIEIK